MWLSACCGIFCISYFFAWCVSLCALRCAGVRCSLLIVFGPCLLLVACLGV